MMRRRLWSSIDKYKGRASNRGGGAEQGCSFPPTTSRVDKLSGQQRLSGTRRGDRGIPKHRAWFQMIFSGENERNDNEVGRLWNTQARAWFQAIVRKIVEYPSTNLVSNNPSAKRKQPRTKQTKKKIQRLRRGGCFNGTFEELGANIPNSVTDEPA